MRKFWNWLFPPLPQGHFAPYLRHVVEESRPDLLDEFDALGSMPLSALGAFLDRNYPRKEGRWGCRSAANVGGQLCYHLDNPQ